MNKNIKLMTKSAKFSDWLIIYFLISLCQYDI